MNVAPIVFLDSNVLVYASDASQLVKGPAARSLLSQLFGNGSPLLSTQVLSEFYWNVTRKIKAPLTHQEAKAEITQVLTLTTVAPVSKAVVEYALTAVELHGIPYWDAQIFAAAKLNGSAKILSEDFQHRGVLEGIVYLNPFAPDFGIAEVLPHFPP